MRLDALWEKSFMRMENTSSSDQHLTSAATRETVEAPKQAEKIPFSEAMATRRLDKVRDIVTEVVLVAEAPPQASAMKPRWADLSDSD